MSSSIVSRVFIMIVCRTLAPRYTFPSVLINSLSTATPGFQFGSSTFSWWLNGSGPRDCLDFKVKEVMRILTTERRWNQIGILDYRYTHLLFFKRSFGFISWFLLVRKLRFLAKCCSSVNQKRCLKAVRFTFWLDGLLPLAQLTAMSWYTKRISSIKWSDNLSLVKGSTVITSTTTYTATIRKWVLPKIIQLQGITSHSGNSCQDH